MSARAIALAVALAGALGACGNDSDPRWQLHHDRIVAIRTTPSHVAAGQVAVLDALVTSVDGGLATQAPATVTAPDGFPDVVRADGQGGWQITAPDAATLDAARQALGLAAGAPVPVELAMTFAVGGVALDATKRAWFGDQRDNPAVGAVTIAGVAPDAMPGARISVPFDTDVALAITQDAADRVNWLTSCGSLDSDDNERAVLLHVKPDDATAGQLAVVVRDDGDGVAWQSWPIASMPR